MSRLVRACKRGGEIAVPIAAMAFAYASICQTVTFADVSMEPTITEGDIGICRRLGTLPNEYKSLKKGDIVMLISPRNPYRLLCKRVTAVEGDEIIHNDDDDDLDEELNDLSLSDSRRRVFRRFVPNGHVWLEGDNEKSSIDSRTFGPVPAGLVTSVLRFKINFEKFSFKWMA